MREEKGENTPVNCHFDNCAILFCFPASKDSCDDTFSLVLPLTEIDEAFKHYKSHTDFKVSHPEWRSCRRFNCTTN